MADMLFMLKAQGADCPIKQKRSQYTQYPIQNAEKDFKKKGARKCQQVIGQCRKDDRRKQFKESACFEVAETLLQNMGDFFQQEQSKSHIKELDDQKFYRGALGSQSGGSIHDSGEQQIMDLQKNAGSNDLCTGF